MNKAKKNAEHYKWLENNIKSIPEISLLYQNYSKPIKLLFKQSYTGIWFRNPILRILPPPVLTC